MGEVKPTEQMKNVNLNHDKAEFRIILPSACSAQGAVVYHLRC